MVSGVVLYAGRDQALAAAREVLLENAGYVVSTCLDVDEFVGQFLDGDFDAVMLCGTLRREERHLMTSLVHRFSRSTPVIVVCALPGERVDDADHVCSGDPEALLAVVSRAVLPPSKGPMRVELARRTAARARQ